MRKIIVALMVLCSIHTMGQNKGQDLSGKSTFTLRFNLMELYTEGAKKSVVYETNTVINFIPGKQPGNGKIKFTFDGKPEEAFVEQIRYFDDNKGRNYMAEEIGGSGILFVWRHDEFFFDDNKHVAIFTNK